MKPRLKLQLNGSLIVLVPGRVNWSCCAADAFIERHYGDRMRFALRFRLNYAAVTAAVSNDTASVNRAGAVAEIRQILGLRSQPSERSRKLVELHAQRRANREPDWVFGVDTSK